MTELKNSKKRPINTVNPIKTNRIKGNKSNTNKNPHIKKVKPNDGKKATDSYNDVENAKVYRLMDSNGQALLPKPVKTIAEKPKKIISKLKRKQLNPEERFQRFLEFSQRHTTLIEQKSKLHEKNKARPGVFEPEVNNSTWKKVSENSNVWNKPIKLVNNKTELRTAPKRPKGPENLNISNKAIKLFDNKTESKIQPKKPKSVENVNIVNKPIKLWNYKAGSKLDSRGPKVTETPKIWNKPNKIVNHKPEVNIDVKVPQDTVKGATVIGGKVKGWNKPIKLYEKAPNSKPHNLAASSKSKNKLDKIATSGLQVKSQVNAIDKSSSMLAEISGKGRLTTKENGLGLKRKASPPRSQAATKIIVRKDDKPAERNFKKSNPKIIYSGKAGSDRGKTEVNKGKEGPKKVNKEDSKQKFKETISTEKAKNLISMRSSIHKAKDHQPTADRFESKFQASTHKAKDPQPTADRFESKFRAIEAKKSDIESKNPIIESNINVKQLKELFSKGENSEKQNMALKTKPPIPHTFPFQQVKASFEAGNSNCRSGGGFEKLTEKTKIKESVSLAPQTDCLKIINAMREDLRFDAVCENLREGDNDDVQNTLKAIMATRDKYMKKETPQIQVESKDYDFKDISVEAQNLQRRAQTLESTKPLERAYMDSTKLENKLIEKKKIQEQSEFAHFFNNKAEDLPRKSSGSFMPVEETIPRVANAAAVFKEEIKASFDDDMIKMAQRYSSQLENARLELSRRLNAL